MGSPSLGDVLNLNSPRLGDVLHLASPSLVLEVLHLNCCQNN